MDRYSTIANNLQRRTIVFLFCRNFHVLDLAFICYSVLLFLTGKKGHERFSAEFMMNSAYPWRNKLSLSLHARMGQKDVINKTASRFSWKPEKMNRWELIVQTKWKIQRTIVVTSVFTFDRGRFSVQNWRSRICSAEMFMRKWDFGPAALNYWPCPVFCSDTPKTGQNGLFARCLIPSFWQVGFCFWQRWRLAGFGSNRRIFRPREATWWGPRVELRLCLNELVAVPQMFSRGWNTYLKALRPL